MRQSEMLADFSVDYMPLYPRIQNYDRTIHFEICTYFGLIVPKFFDNALSGQQTQGTGWFVVHCTGCIQGHGGFSGRAQAKLRADLGKQGDKSQNIAQQKLQNKQRAATTNKQQQQQQYEEVLLLFNHSPITVTCCSRVFFVCSTYILSC
jgi:hypothetical protein